MKRNLSYILWWFMKRNINQLTKNCANATKEKKIVQLTLLLVAKSKLYVKMVDLLIKSTITTNHWKDTISHAKTIRNTTCHLKTLLVSRFNYFVINTQPLDYNILSCISVIFYCICLKKEEKKTRNDAFFQDQSDIFLNGNMVAPFNNKLIKTYQQQFSLKNKKKNKKLRTASLKQNALIPIKISVYQEYLFSGAPISDSNLIFF